MIKNKYIKSMMTLVSGSIVAQLVTLICAPIITRIFTPEDLGIYALVTGVLTMFGAIMSFRFELCIVSEKDEKKLPDLIKLCFISCIFLSFIITIGYYIYYLSIKIEGNPIMYAIITGLLAFLVGIINVLTAYNNRFKEYKLMSRTYIRRVASQNILNIISGLLKFNVLGLVISHILGYCAGIPDQAKPLWKIRKDILKSKNTLTMAKENIRQFSMSTPAAFANGVSYSLINYFIESLFTVTLVGYYSMSSRILGLPLTVISLNLSRVFHEKAIRDYDNTGKFHDTFKTTVKIGILIAIPMGVLLILFAPWACELFFGEGWRAAGIYIRILTPMFMLRLIAGTVNTTAIIVNKQSLDLKIQMILTALIVFVFLVSNFMDFKIEIFLSLINISTSIVYIIYICIFWKYSKGYLRKVV